MARGDLWISEAVRIPEDEILESVSRSRGPGGQHVNKTETRVTLHWNAVGTRALRAEPRARMLRALAGRLTRSGEIVVRSDSYRSRARNRDAARERLAQLLRDALVVREKRVATRPTRGSDERRLAAKRGRAEHKRARGRVREHDS
jgi:ribosome-associated protein